MRPKPLLFIRNISIDFPTNFFKNKTTGINFAKSRLTNVVRKLQELRDNGRIFQNLFKGLSGKLDLDTKLSKFRSNSIQE
jgi:hypothetical protein